MNKGADFGSRYPTEGETEVMDEDQESLASIMMLLAVPPTAEEQIEADMLEEIAIEATASRIAGLAQNDSKL